MKFRVHCTGQVSLHEQAVPVSSVSVKSVSKVHSAALRDHESILTYNIALWVHVRIIRSFFLAFWGSNYQDSTCIIVRPWTKLS